MREQPRASSGKQEVALKDINDGAHAVLNSEISGAEALGMIFW